MDDAHRQQDSDEALEYLIRYDRAEWQGWEEDEGVGYEYEAKDEELAECEDENWIESSEESISAFRASRVEIRNEFVPKKKGSRKKKQAPSVETIITLEEEVRTTSIAASSTTDTEASLESGDVSDSQLKLMHFLDKYPSPDDPGNVQAFWILYDPLPIYTNDGIKKFAHIMETQKLRPIACMAKLLNSNNVNLRYYGLNSKSVPAICESLYYNYSVRFLDLKDNWLTPEACLHLKNLLVENTMLTSMNLSGCKIGCEGVRNILPGITENVSLVELDLSHCRLGDEGFNSLAPIIENNWQLKTLNLADNQLGTECAEALQAMLAGNAQLTHLNLSWNGLFSKEAATALFKGLLENTTLLSVDASWNAFGKEALASLSVFLQRNQTLVSLNLSGNRFDESAGATIAKSLAKNVTLQEIHLGDNPLKPAGGSALVRALLPDQSPYTKLRYVDLENVWLQKDVLPDLEQIKNQRPWLRVRLGGVFSNFKLVGPDERKIYFERAIFEGMKPKQKKKRKDFGHFILSLTDKLISRENFRRCVKAFKIKLSDTLVEALAMAFPGGKKKVDQTSMKAVFLQQYPHTTAPPPPVAKNKKGKQKQDVDAGEKREEPIINKVEITKEKNEKGNDENTKMVMIPLSESDTEEEFDEYEDEEEYEEI